MKHLALLPALFGLSALAPAQRVIGLLGQATDKAPLYRAPNGASRVVYTAKPFQYLCVNWSPRSEYLKVTMTNGTQAFVRSKDVAVLPYQVTQGATRTGRPLGAAPGGASRGAATQWSLNFVGTPYVWGGNDIQRGVDCSGFVKKVYGQIGLNLPRTAAEQALVGTPVRSYRDLQAGDRLYFWDKKRGKIGHTGLYLGNGYFVHSSRGKGGVNTDLLSAHWQKILVSAMR